MRRGSTVEELYTEALALAERGGALEQQAQGATSRDAARQCFIEAVRIFSRLAVVESAAKRALVQDVVSDLSARIVRLDEPSTVPIPQPQPEPPRGDEPSLLTPATPSDAVDADAALTNAMEIHRQARDAEDAGDRAQCIELYLSAGDWYMTAYGAFEPEAQSAKDAVREQIEYVIGHVSQLKSMTQVLPLSTSDTADESSAATASNDATVDGMHWPMPPDESPEVTASAEPCDFALVELPAHENPPLFDDVAWPQPPLAFTPVLQAATSQSSTSSRREQESRDDMAWPLPPGAEDSVEAFDWPMPPVPQPSKRRSVRHRTPPSRTSSQELLPVSRQSSANAIPSFLSPVGDEAVAYSPAELDVLRRSSQINGHIFVPWLDDLDAHENFRSVHLYDDPDGMVPLSAKQIRKGATWMRPSAYADVCAHVPVMINSICPQVVKQDIVTDCSFVASLCIAAAYEQRFQKRLITNIIYPVDPATRQPVYNPSGKYIVKLWANGVPRKIVIDDLLPVNIETRELLCSCTTRQNELWVSLIEKAYLKLHGGYDYPGGNSGIDLFALTGWIPERIPIADLAVDAMREERIWEQLKSAFHFGDCIITMTTGDISRDDAIQIGLVPMHVYAVLNVYETTVLDEASGEPTKRKLLHVKNPWRKLSWRGPYSNSDTAAWQGPLGDELRTYQDQYYALGETKTEAESGDDVGLFWIDLDSVKQHFESLYLNWNPELFPHKYAIHEHWPVALGPRNDSITLAYNPQYSVRFIRRRSESVHTATARATATRSSSTVWVLLTRHVSTVERDAENVMQQFLTLHVYRGTDGRRVYYNQDAMHRGTYSNNPHTLLSLDVDFDDDEPEPSFTLVASQYEKFAPLDYTLSVFSTTPFVCRPVPHIESAPNAIVLANAWTSDIAGGRPFFSTFMENPQYHVQLNPTTLERLWVFLEITNESESDSDSDTAQVPVNLRVITHSQWRACGLPAVSSSSPQRILSSGEYRPGFCLVELDGSDEGAMLGTCSDLVIIPSTFEAGTLAPFRLRIVSEPPDAILQANELPMEGSRYNATILRGQWDASNGTAVGCASYGCYTFNPKYLVHVVEETYLFARLIPVRGLASTGTGSSSTVLPSCNVSIYSSAADGTLLLSTNPTTAFRHATSDGGAYASGNPSGVVTPSATVFPAGWYVIVPSTYDPQQAAYELRVYASKRVAVRQLDA